MLVISQTSAFITIHYNISYDINILLFSLVVAFPLVFSIQSAFKRRDRALEYFSLFRAGASGLHNSFRISEDLPAEKKQEAYRIVKDLAAQLLVQLENKKSGYKTVQEKVDQVMAFIEQNRENLSNRNILRMIRYLRDVTEGSSYLVSLVTHRTMAGLRFYSLVFIMAFPLIQAPIMYYHIQGLVSSNVLYVAVGFTSLVLITLSNFQEMIEYPFDPRGVDNIKIKEFSLE